jgi:transposase
MKIPTKFVKPLSPKGEQELKELMAEYPTRREWIRAHSIKLSAKGYSIDQIAEIHEVDRDTVAIWLKAWEESGSEGLKDNPISGRPRKLNNQEEDLAKDLIKKEPRSLKRVANEIESQTGKKN